MSNLAKLDFGTHHVYKLLLLLFTILLNYYYLLFWYNCSKISSNILYQYYLGTNYLFILNALSIIETDI